MSLIAIDWKPDKRKLRSFSLVWTIGWFLIGLVLALKLGDVGAGELPKVSLVCWVSGILIGITGLLFPQLVKPVYYIWMGITYPIGWVMSHLLLFIVFYVIFTPTAWLFRLAGRDTLQLKHDPWKKSTWKKHQPPYGSERYFRQF
jgi:hypothetical protein